MLHCPMRPMGFHRLLSHLTPGLRDFALAAPSAWSTLPRFGLTCSHIYSSLCSYVSFSRRPSLTRPFKSISFSLLLNLFPCFIFLHRIFHHITCSTFNTCALGFFGQFSSLHYNLHGGRDFFPVVTAISLTSTAAPGT